MPVFAVAIAFCPAFGYGSGFKGQAILEGVCRVVPGFVLEANRQALFVCPAKLDHRTDGTAHRQVEGASAVANAVTWQPFVARHYGARNKMCANGDLCQECPSRVAAWGRTRTSANRGRPRQKAPAALESLKREAP